MNPLEAQQVEQARRQINQIAEEIAQLSEADMQPAQYYSEFLQRVYFALQAFAAAVWIRTPQGNLVLQCQINLRELGLDRTPDSRPMHDELLAPGRTAGERRRHPAALQPQLRRRPRTGRRQPDRLRHPPRADPAGKAGHRPGRRSGRIPIASQRASRIFYQFLVRMAAFVSLFQRNHQLRQMLGQQELWLKLETFARQIHGSLHTTECSYLIANEAPPPDRGATASASPPAGARVAR